MRLLRETLLLSLARFLSKVVPVSICRKQAARTKKFSFS
jgi:hypothetical protein